MCDCDGPTPEFYGDKIVISLKQFKCCECCDTIPAGRKCEVATGKWDDKIQTIRTCIPCLVRWSRFECRMLGDLCEEYSQMDDITGAIHEWLDKRNERIRAIRKERNEQTV